MVNLDPTKPEMGLAKKIHTVHDVLGCTLDGKQGCLSTRSTMRINHYMGSKGDFFDVRTNFWPVSCRLADRVARNRSRGVNNVWTPVRKKIFARRNDGQPQQHN